MDPKSTPEQSVISDERASLQRADTVQLETYNYRPTRSSKTPTRA
jgi:hypothetical protein